MAISAAAPRMRCGAVRRSLLANSTPALRRHQEYGSATTARTFRLALGYHAPDWPRTGTCTTRCAVDMDLAGTPHCASSVRPVKRARAGTIDGPKSAWNTAVNEEWRLETRSSHAGRVETSQEELLNTIGVELPPAFRTERRAYGFVQLAGSWRSRPLVTMYRPRRDVGAIPWARRTTTCCPGTS